MKASCSFNTGRVAVSTLLFGVMALASVSTAVAQPWFSGYYSAGNTNLPVSQIPWAKYTDVIIFAASTDGQGNAIPYYLTQSEINQFTQSNPPGTKVLVCIKDNDNNYAYFGQSTQPSLIANFVTSIANFVTSNGFDGVDIDWEKHVNVTQFDDLLSRLRAAMPDKVITMASNGNNYQAAKDSQASLDQVNLMCYDEDWGLNKTYFVGALWEGSDGDQSCDQSVAQLTNPSLGTYVPNNKIGIGIPYYGRRWARASAPLQSSRWSSVVTFYYRDLVTDITRWNDAYKKWDGGWTGGTYPSSGSPVQGSPHGADYLSINTSNLQEFDSYTGPAFMQAAAGWAAARGFGGFMSFTIEYEHISAQQCDAAFPLSSALNADAALPSTVLNVLSATTGTSNQVTLSWSACAGGATYNLYRSTNSRGPYTLIAGNLVGSTFIDNGDTDTVAGGPVNGTPYYYYVATADSNLNPLGNSNQVSATPTDASLLPLPPTNLAASSSKRQIQIKWAAPADAAAQGDVYEIWRSTSGSTTFDGSYKYIDTTPNTSYTNLGMATGTTYYYLVRAKNSQVTYSVWSNRASATAK